MTGGAGFIGSHVVDRLVAEGFEVRVLDDLSSGCLDNIGVHVDSGKAEFLEGDIKDEKTVAKCMHGVGFVVHLAAVVSVPFSIKNPDLTFQTNLKGTVNVLVASAKAKVSRLVFASTCAVYGDSKYLPVDEEHPLNPISSYAESKLAAERFVIGFCERGVLDCVALRFFNVYGPRQCMSDYSGVITKFIDFAKHGMPLTVYGDGSATRDFVFVGDVVDAIMLCRQRKEACGEVFNVGTGKATTVKELAETVLELVPRGSDINYGPPRSGDIKDSYANVTKAERLLGFTARTGLQCGLRVLISRGEDSAT